MTTEEQSFQTDIGKADVDADAASAKAKEDMELQMYLKTQLELPKKKKKKQKDILLEQFEHNNNTDKITASALQENAASNNDSVLPLEQQEQQQIDGKLYEYESLLNRLYNFMSYKKPDESSGSNKTGLIPILTRKNKITTIENFTTVLKSIQRKKVFDDFEKRKAHMVEYLLFELFCQGHVSNEKLILRGRFQSERITNILLKYVKEYILCKNCKSTNTTINKCKIIHKYYNECDYCSSKIFLKELMK